MTITSLTGSNNTWLRYSSSCFNLTIKRLLLSGGLGSDQQLLKTSLTEILHKLPFILGSLPLGITTYFLNNILLDTSTFSSLYILSNSFGKKVISSLFETAWHGINLFFQCFIASSTYKQKIIIWFNQRRQYHIYIIIIFFFE